MRHRQFFAFSVLTLALNQVYAAQDERVSNSQESLPEVVVTATRTAKVVSEAPATVTVVTAKEIRYKNANRVDEALAGAPGVFISALGDERPSNYQNQITLRGIPGYYRTGVLVDGIQVNNAFSGGVNLSLAPVDDIKQIEVVPGPFSSLYGGAGMAGVINVITKAPEKREVSAKGQVATNNFRSVDLGYRDKFANGAGVSLSYGHKQSDGYVDTYLTKTPAKAGGTIVSGWQQTVTNTGTTTYIAGDKGRVAWEQDRVGAKFYLDLPASSKLVLDASYLTHRTKDGFGTSYLSAGGVPFTSGTANINGLSAAISATEFLATTTGEDLTRVAATYETQFSNLKLKANLGYQSNHYWYNSITANATNISGPGSLSDIPNNMLNGDVQVGFPAGNSQYLIVGTSFNNSDLRKRVYALNNWRAIDNMGALGDWADANSRAIAAYVQDEISLSDQLTFYAGIRHDRAENHGTIFINNTLTNYATRNSSATSPKVALVYKFNDGTVFRGALGKAFRSPNLSDMYSTYKAGATIYWSNPDLMPEKVTTAELGIEHEFATQTLLRATVYRSDFSDLLYSTTVGGKSTKLNAGKADARGIDLEVRQKFTGGLQAFANATIASTTITQNTAKPTSTGKQIPLQAKRMANVGLEGGVGPWSGSLIGSYVGKRYSLDDNTDVVNNVYGSHDPYFITNAKLAYRINKEFAASFSVNNLFDRNYFLGTSIATGRGVYLGLEFKN
ncbi:MAG TPA: TonB-dependent receptor [Gallionella sp.]|nr:TonB-dependent receptor [Gallionella sp.]